MALRDADFGAAYGVLYRSASMLRFLAVLGLVACGSQPPASTPCRLERIQLMQDGAHVDALVRAFNPGASVTTKNLVARDDFRTEPARKDGAKRSLE